MGRISCTADLDERLSQRLSRLPPTFTARGVRRPSISYPPAKVFQYAAGTFDFAVERFEVAPGETVPV